uniref:Uncharacterized protein n=1 Tax=Arundo donax TaxID=35708 RepID=A0A0A9HBJ5_ARUDO
MKASCLGLKATPTCLGLKALLLLYESIMPQPIYVLHVKALDLHDSINCTSWLRQWNW